jgi:hypothetical protein
MDKINGDDLNSRSGATWSVIASQMHETISFVIKNIVPQKLRRNKVKIQYI